MVLADLNENIKKINGHLDGGRCHIATVVEAAMIILHESDEKNPCKYTATAAHHLELALGSLEDLDKELKAKNTSILLVGTDDTNTVTLEHGTGLNLK